MPIQYSYTDAAQRLLTDAFALWQSGTRETAAHVAGLSAECVLKSILVGLNLVAVAGDGQIASPPNANRRYRVHINKLWGEFQSQLQGHRGVAYAALLPASVPAPFDNWLVDHRYVAAQQLIEADLERWMWMAIAMGQVLTQAVKQKDAQ